MLIQTRTGDRHTLVDILRSRASSTPGQRAYTYLRDGETDELSVDYRELDRRARRLGGWLHYFGAAGPAALLLCSRGLEFLAAFFGWLCACGIDVRPHQ